MNSNQPYETLDPQDWETMRTLAHQMIDDSNRAFNTGLSSEDQATVVNVINLREVS